MSQSPSSSPCQSPHPTVGEAYPAQVREGTLAEYIDNEYFNQSVLQDAEDMMPLFLDALNSRKFYHTTEAGEFGAEMFENADTGSVHVAVFNDDLLIAFSAFSSRASALAAVQEFSAQHSSLDEERSFFDRICDEDGDENGDEDGGEWDTFLRRHQAGKYNTGFKAVEMVDEFSWA